MCLKGNTNKVSKSDPDGGVFIENSGENILRKI
jgi:tryptophanyl-tRNA synthetase